MANKPTFGLDMRFKMRSPAYIQLYDGTITTRYATSTLAKAALNGVPGEWTIIMVADAVADDYDGLYFLVSSPASTFCVWFFETGAATATQPVVAAADAYVKVEYAATATAAEMATNVYNACSGLADFTMSIATSTTVHFLCAQGGYCASADASVIVAAMDTLVDFTEVTAPLGGWAKLGKLADDLELTPEPVKVADSQGGNSVVEYTLTTAINLQNISQRTRDIIDTEYKGRYCNIAFMNETATACPVAIIHNIPIDSALDLFGGDTAQINISAEETFTDVSTYLKYWTYEMTYA